MKKLNNYQRTVQYLVKVFKLINEDYFENSLPQPQTTVQSTVGAYGHITTSKVWKNDDGMASYELNIGADYLYRPIEELVATLIHESVHLYCLENDIKDTSNRGIYHNKTFKRIAEDKGHLIISRHPKYGWTITEPSEETLDFCIRHELTDVLITRQSNVLLPGKSPKTKRPSSTRKYMCPCCGNSFRATKFLRVLCMDCDEQFVLA
ncbi:MAG: SprT family zinc-dependent metalloprotease [Lachnospiraceae bacterium]|nr:SprT family zinc-dependent metalloprotease [Lachnospiraceae bacterium]